MIVNERTSDFVMTHRNDDVKQLALKGTRDKDVDLPFSLNQIQGWQTAKKKLPTWANSEGIIYPPHLNMEQCSSEETARYKTSLISKVSDNDVTFVDLTGGFGVDFSYMSRRFKHAVYVEQNKDLCEIARHNFCVLGLDNVEVVNGDGVEYLHGLTGRYCLYLDPARRDTNGHKVYGIEDCTPDVLTLKDELLKKADMVMIKLSPMLDWHAAVKAFDGACEEIHIVSVNNECKELLVILKKGDFKPHIVCVNDNQCFSYYDDAEKSSPRLIEDIETVKSAIDMSTAYLYIPNASIMKAGCFERLTVDYDVAMVDKDSHIFFSETDINAFPGRKFRIVSFSTMNKKELRTKFKDIDMANISVRNFPLSPEALRKRLKLKDGGEWYVFATTIQHNHVLFITKK